MNPLPINLSSLLHGRSVEWERLEFKRGWNPVDVLHTVCAFANDFHNFGGGYIVIGLEEKDGKPVFPAVGVRPEEINAIQKEILNFGNTAIQPVYHPILTPYDWDGKTLLVIWVPGGQVRPYKAKVSLGKEAKEYAYFIRKGSSTVRAKGNDEAELLSLAATVPFDDRINQQARISDLSRNLLEEFLREIDSKLLTKLDELSLEDLARQMQIVDGPKEFTFPRNVGLLFFHPEPHRFFPGTQIDVVAFPRGTGGDKFTEKIFQGPLPRIIRESLDYIRRNFLVEIVTKHPDRAEATRVWNYSFAAIEEALVNAIYHRSYEQREPVEVRITPTEITILSFPGPDRSINMEQLREGKAVSRRYRNRRIGEFLKELDLTEGRATGIPKILRGIKVNGSPLPEFESDDDRLAFLIRFPVHPDTPEESKLGAESLAESLAESVAESEEQLRERVLGFLAEEPLSKGEMTSKLGRKTVTGTLNRLIRQLLEEGVIEMTIPEKPNSRLQKYRLTTK
ncbi:MAG: putative DNA binding domain-containing protein [Planctomycetaceae bacterium]|nr:putative DNA binding domain-containing protein [Planctomycetaceae bacterium]